MIKPPPPRHRIQYKKPSRLNLVSFSMLVIMAAMGYVGYTLLPAFSLRANAKGELADRLPDIWRANLRPPMVGAAIVDEVKKDLVVKLRRVGVKDKKLRIIIRQNKEFVSIEAQFIASAEFRIMGMYRRIDFNMAPRVETDAARIDW